MSKAVTFSGNKAEKGTNAMMRGPHQLLEVEVKAAWGRMLNIPLVAGWIVVFFVNSIDAPLPTWFFFLSNLLLLLLLLMLPLSPLQCPVFPSHCCSCSIQQICALPLSHLLHLLAAPQNSAVALRCTHSGGNCSLAALSSNILYKKNRGGCNHKARPCASEPPHVHLYQRS